MKTKRGTDKGMLILSVAVATVEKAYHSVAVAVAMRDIALITTEMEALGNNKEDFKIQEKQLDSCILTLQLYGFVVAGKDSY